MFDAKQHEDNRFLLYFNDGLIDIFIGMGIFFAGLFLWSEMVWMAAIFIPIFLPSFQSARNRFLKPRIGMVGHAPQFQAQGVKLLLYFALLLGVFVLAGVGMFLAFGVISGPVNDWIRNYFLLILGAVFGSVWVIAAMMLKVSRFYLHAFLTFISLVSVQFVGFPFWVALSLTGGLIIIIGLIVFIRFLQEYPISGRGV